jgi:hypothetical protein
VGPSIVWKVRAGARLPPCPGPLFMLAVKG